jgi:uncharacterized membrane protein YphA (DoxX/SURF4 family)
MLFNNSLDKRTSLGLLLQRVGLSAMLLIHSVPKLIDGSAQWSAAAKVLSFLKLGLPEQFTGLVILILEAAAALSLLSGYFFRTFCVLMTILYGLHCYSYFAIGYKTLTLFALGLTTVFIGLMNTGPGRYAISVKLEKK